MKTHWLIWIPRVLIMLYALFTMLFSFDVFGGDEPFWRQLGGFMIHNIFFFVLCFILVATWRLPLAAAIFFIAFGIVLTALFYERWDWIAYLALGCAPVITGLLFALAYFLGKRAPAEA